ncbi:MAG: penicillin-binding protein 2 [Acidobacteriota bacterium]|nr:penicillin-binding protein 2 [Acidobacteriota bacterium]
MKLQPTPLAFKGRIYFMMGLTLLGFLVVLSGYWRVQVFKQEQYERLGEQYRIKTKEIKASRGFIYDRKGRLIAQNRPTYNLVLQRDEMEEPWRRLKPKLAEFVGLPADVLEERYRKRSHLLSQPVLLKENISFKESLRIRRNLRRYPGLSIDTTEKRFYVYNDLFTHVLGYVAEVSKKELERNPELKPGELVGKLGVELAYNEELTGVDGSREVHIDNKGRYRRQDVTKQPEPGRNLHLSLDLDLQQLAYDALEGNGGSIVMMDVRTGEILVYISSPTFDLNLFTDRFPRREWVALSNSPDKPFLNRPVKGAYAPGSIFKLVSALAGLKFQKITPDTRYFCKGSFSLNNHVSRCHNEKGHGWLDLEGAIKYSCNVYFYNISQSLDIDELAVLAGELGFGRKTGIDLIGENPGLMPTRAWKRERYGQIWYPGESLSVAIGQGALVTTPVQLVTLIASIAAEGRVPTPHFMARVGKDNDYQTFQPELHQIEGIPSDHYRIVKEAMWQVVNNSRGTGINARVKGFDVCGKTGTAQLQNFTKDADHKNEKLLNALFAGFAPRDNPEVAVLVLVEQVGAGGKKAAPIAKRLLEEYRRLRREVDPT